MTARIAALALALLATACDFCDQPPFSETQACVYVHCKEMWTGDVTQGEGFCREQAGLD